ncbi:hypothetical protein CJJ19_01145 [Candidatus Williamhamiltonella defendens]|nr:hypothetical protein CJJ19_01145 [Candidatus Hamiltonella defensa]
MCPLDSGVFQSELESKAPGALVMELVALRFKTEFILLKGENPIKCEKAHSKKMICLNSIRKI